MDDKDVANFVKGHGEVHNQYICLHSNGQVVGYVINKLNKLGFTGTSAAESAKTGCACFLIPFSILFLITYC